MINNSIPTPDVSQTAMRVLVVCPLRCQWPKQHIPKPLWYVREVEALEEREASLWAEYELAERRGEKGVAAVTLAKHRRVRDSILRLHTQWIEGGR